MTVFRKSLCIFSLFVKFCVLICSGAETSTEISTKIVHNSKFNIYWNVPSFQCDPFKMNFSEILEKYKITQNKNARFRGDKIVILYDPGDFPALLVNSKGKLYQRNSGVPQNGNLTLHLKLFKNLTEDLIPDPDFSGLAIIDFESWRPIFRQNFGVLEPYKNLSTELVKKQYPEWPRQWIEKQAQKRFEEAGRTFMQETLTLAKKLRPKASWGYYAYPYCFNKLPNKNCPKNVQMENDRTLWLFNTSDSLYPSVYFYDQKMTTREMVEMVQGRIDESVRLNRQLNKNKKIFPYFTYKYQNTDEFLTKMDLISTLSALVKSQASGVILWGSSKDVNNKQRCKDLYEYVDQILGPIIQSF